MPSAHWEGYAVTLYFILAPIQTLLKCLLSGEVFTGPPSWFTCPTCVLICTRAPGSVLYCLCAFLSPSSDC